MRERKLFPIFLVMFTEVIGFSLLLPFLPYYAAQFGASPLVIASIFTTFSFFQFLSAPILGKLSDKYGRKPLFLLSQFSTFLGFVILGFANSLGMIFLSRIVDGVFGSNMVISRAYIADLTSPSERTKAYNYAGAVFAVGFMIGPSVGGYLSRWGFHVPAFLAAAVSLVSLYFITRLEETVTTGQDVKIEIADFVPMRSLLRALREEKIRELMVEFGLFIFAFSMMMPNFAVLLNTKFGIGATTVGFLLMFVGVFRIMLQGGVLPRLVKAIGDESLKISGFLAIALAFLSFLGRGYLYLAMALFSYGSSAIRPVIMSEATKFTHKKNRGAFLGVFDSLDSLARIVAPLLGGALMEFVSPDSIAIFGAAVLIVGFLFSCKHRIKESHRLRKVVPIKSQTGRNPPSLHR